MSSVNAAAATWTICKIWMEEIQQCVSSLPSGGNVMFANIFGIDQNEKVINQIILTLSESDVVMSQPGCLESISPPPPLATT